MSKAGLGCFGVIVLLAAGLVAIFPWVHFVTDSAWFQALGYSEVFNTRWETQWGLFWTYGLGTAAALGITWALAGFLPGKDEDGMGPIMAVAGILLALVAGTVAGFAMSDQWQYAILAEHMKPMGQTDPIFHKDIAFYMLQLPFLHTQADLMLTVGLGAAIGAWVIAGVRGLPYGPSVVAGLVTAAFFGLCYYGMQLGQYDYLFNRDGVVQGAGYTAVNVSIPWQGYAAAACIVAAIVVGILAVIPKPGVAPAGVVIGLLIPLLVWGLGGIGASITESGTVKNNQTSLEAPYIQREIKATKTAFGLNNVEVRPTTGDVALSSQDIANDQTTINDLRLWDTSAMNESNDATQVLNGYYNFHGSDMDRYTIDGQEQMVEVSARELDPAKLPPRAQIWVNQHFRYTHGYGMVAATANQVTATGDPNHLVTGIPPQGVIAPKNPDIYFGVADTTYALAPSKYDEFDHPNVASGQEDTTHYAGTHAPKVDQNRFAWAMATGDYNLWVSPEVDSKTEILYNRSVLGRVKELAPFFTYDDPYLVTDGNKMYWIVDAMTSSTNYPYSQTEAGGVSYLRNPVKVVVDTYEGTVDFYVFDKTDPFVAALSDAEPQLFKPSSQFPAALQSHLRYPEQLFSVQAQVYGTYHNENTQAFFDRSDVWQFATEQRCPTCAQEQVKPYYSLGVLPGEQKPEFHMGVPMVPYTNPNAAKPRTNLSAWMAVRMDGSDYGKLVVFEMPRDHTVQGPLAIMSTINTYPKASQDFTYFNQHGSTVEFGQMFVVPVGKGVLYFEPIYLKATNGLTKPQLKRILVGDGTGRVGYGNTVADALADMLGVSVATGPASSPTGTPGQPVTMQSLLQQALGMDDQAKAALKAGDVVTYQKDMVAIEQILQQMKALPAPAATPSPAATPQS